MWQEDAIRFFDSVELGAADAGSAYVELSHKVESELSHLSPYWSRLGLAMRHWVDIWREREAGTLAVRPSRSSSGTSPRIDEPTTRKPTCAILTYVRNEMHTLPIWLRYYLRHSEPRDIHILDHMSTDGGTSTAAIPPGVHVKQIGMNETHWMPHMFLVSQVEAKQKQLLQSGYPCVLLAEVDDIIAPDPESYPGGLRQFLVEFVASHDDHWATTGMQLAHVSHGDQPEPALNWSASIMAQRTYWGIDRLFNKPYLSKLPMRWAAGFHQGEDRVHRRNPRPHNKLFLIHLHHADRAYCDERSSAKHKMFVEKGMLSLDKKLGWGKGLTTAFHPEMIKFGHQICGWAHTKRLEPYPGQVMAAVKAIPNHGIHPRLQVIPPKWRGVLI